MHHYIGTINLQRRNNIIIFKIFRIAQKRIFIKFIDFNNNIYFIIFIRVVLRKITAHNIVL